MAQKHTFDYDLIVIGSGAGGSAAATIVARSGKKVAIVEADAFGGDFQNWSDVPTKALLHAAHLYDEARHAARFGLRSATLGYNYPSLRTWKDLAVSRTGTASNRRYYENQGISAFQGIAHFLSPNEISVNRRHLSASKFLIASGSYWQTPDIPGISEAGYITPRGILESIRPPKSLFIIGAGDTGVEIAQLMAIFGTKVYISDEAKRILPNEDSEVGELMERVLSEQKGITSLTQTKVVSATKDGLAKRVTILRGGVEKSIRVDEILIATDKVPRVDFGLENATVQYSDEGISVNEYLQTSAKHIFAAGDVLGRQAQTHTATLESRVVAHNILNSAKAIPNYVATPNVIFTYPGIARVGMTEDECKENKLVIKKAIAPLNMVARSNTSDFRDGFVKIITDKKGVIVGATVVAPHAGEMIHELALAVKYGLTADDVAETPHAFLSWSEAIRMTASKLS